MSNTVLLILAPLVAFATTFFATRIFIRFLRNIGIVGKDAHKKDTYVPEMGGVPVFAGTVAAMFLFIFINTFFTNIIKQNELINIFALLFSITIVLIIGMFDDMTILIKEREKKFKRVGFKQWQRPLLILPTAIPLMAVSAGSTIINLPFIGPYNFGVLFPLILVPIALVFGSEAVNLLAGFNGMESGIGFVSSLSLGILALIKGNISVGILLISFAASLLAFLKFNWFPAKIWPGDSLTHMIGVVIVGAAIIGNFEKAAIILLLPFIIEFLLKARSKFKAECFGVLRKDGKLDPPYGKKIYSWTHLIMNIKPMRENEVSKIMILIEVVTAAAMFYLILGNIF